jgi:cation diffusion facilitator CzcD-associated flavoprotein CzcO
VHNLKSGVSFDDEADVVVSARGNLNDIAWPQVDGLSNMKIPMMHSAAWDHR